MGDIYDVVIVGDGLIDWVEELEKVGVVSEEGVVVGYGEVFVGR